CCVRCGFHRRFPDRDRGDVRKHPASGGRSGPFDAARLSVQRAQGNARRADAATFEAAGQGTRRTIARAWRNSPCRAHACACGDRTEIADRKIRYGTNVLLRTCLFRRQCRTGRDPARENHRRQRHIAEGRIAAMIKTFGQAPPPPTFFEKLKEGLSKSTGALGENITGIFTKKKLDAVTLGELEEALIRADMGAAQAAKIAAAVGDGRYEREISDAEIKSILASELTKLLSPVQKPLDIDSSKKPFVILVAGVNGTGKTTTIGKIAKRLTDQGLKLVLAAGDTFRAAAIEQLQVWGQRTGAEVVARAAGADAA